MKLLPFIFALVLSACNSTTKTVTVESPDGTTTTTVTTNKKVDKKALLAGAGIAGKAATIYLQSQSNLSK